MSLRSPPMLRVQLSLADLVASDHEAHKGARGIGVNVGKLVDLQGPEREDVAVRLVALRWARAAEARLAKVGAALDRALRQLAAGRARALRQPGCGHRNVDHCPVPPAAAGRRVGIVDGKRHALGILRHARPFKRGGAIAALAAKALKYVLVGQSAAPLDGGALQLEGVSLRSSGKWKRRGNQQTMHEQS